MFWLRPANERGHEDHGWLEARHTFSFADYYDPAHMGFRCLRVINEDRIKGGSGFPTHGHRDMEIITFIVEGALAHKDSMGHAAVIRPGEVQTMTAGTGVKHSEFNHLADQLTHLYQIWIEPDGKGHRPSYGQKSFVEDFRKKNLVLTVSKDGREGSLKIHQDAELFVGHLRPEQRLDFSLRKDRHAWIQVVRGQLKVNDLQLSEGDGLAVSEESQLTFFAQNLSDFLLFDLP